MTEKDINLNWGNLVEFSSNNGTAKLDDDRVRDDKNLTSVSAAQSTTISSVKGDTYPNGYALFLSTF